MRALLCICTLGALTAPAAAQQLRLSDAVAMLDADNADEVRMGIEGLGAIGGSRVVAPLATRIRKGLPAELLGVAVETLGLVSHRDAGPVLFELVNHRRSEVRLAATQAIVSCEPAGAERALVAALSDSDPRVRAAAALGLGQLGARGSIDELFHAFDRRILEAATAIGQLATASEVDRLLGYLGRVPFDAVTPALNEIVARREVPQRVKLNVIGQLAELATPEVRTYLQELAEALPDGAVRRAAEEAMLRITGAE
ncbi:MAG: HEAT repeat domain-containing protein [Myxococcota bacterium]